MEMQSTGQPTPTTPTPTPTPTPPAAAPVKCTWMPTTAGILIIIAGVLDLLIGIGVTTFGAFFAAMAGMMGLGAFGIPAIILGIVAIVAGVYSIRRRLWGLAPAGAIIALWPGNILGILSIIFVSLSRREFCQKCA